MAVAALRLEETCTSSYECGSSYKEVLFGPTLVVTNTRANEGV